MCRSLSFISMVVFLIIRRPPRPTRTDNTLSLPDALPICRFGLASKDPAVRDKYLRKATMAENTMWEMIEYQKGQAPVVCKRASYNDQVAAVDFGDQIGRAHV